MVVLRIGALFRAPTSIAVVKRRNSRYLVNILRLHPIILTESDRLISYTVIEEIDFSIFFNFFRSKWVMVPRSNCPHFD